MPKPSADLKGQRAANQLRRDKSRRIRVRQPHTCNAAGNLRRDVERGITPGEIAPR
jgi:hypothetical protein